MRLRARRDATHAEVREAFRRAGWYWMELAALGRGIPDGLACSPAGRVVLVEVKSPGGVLTDAEAKFSMAYPGEYVTVFSVEDVARIVKRG